MEIDQGEGGSGGSPIDEMQDENEYDDIPYEYDEELEQALQAAESQSKPTINHGTTNGIIHEIEDLPLDTEAIKVMSPFQQFRKRGYLSVSDLVGPVWCETQYDYRLRTLPYLPPSQRPDIIKSKEGNEIVVDKVKVEGKEKILKRGEKIHKRLEREIHPEEIRVQISTDEDVWGLRFLNMLAAMEALLVLGKCRELPVVGFVKGVLVYGVIDEIIREPIPSPSTSTSSSDTPSNQTSLKTFFTSSRPALPKIEPKTHRLYISDSKTRASNVLPKEEDTLSGRLQVMLYKDLLDAILLSSSNRTSTASSTHNENGQSGRDSKSILPSRNSFSWDFVFAHLDLDSTKRFSEGFLEQSKSVVVGNGLRYGSDKAKNLNDLKLVWNQYVLELGLGSGMTTTNRTMTAGKGKGKEKEEEKNLGKTEDLLKLVYRRAGGKKNHKKGDRRRGKRRRRGTRLHDQVEGQPSPSYLLPTENDEKVEAEERRLIELAIKESLKSCTADPIQTLVDDEVVDIVQSDETAENKNMNMNISRPPTRTSEEMYWGSDNDEQEQDSKEEDELAWAVEMSLDNPDLETGIEGGQGVVNVLKTPVSSQQSTSNDTTIHSSSASKGTDDDQEQEQGDIDNLPSGTIIGTHKFNHSPLLLAKHLENVLQFWMGEREPSGVTLEQTRRCGWCEFEEGCEWRLKKAKEIWESRKLT
ncbi:hypothetical protein V865_007804 [Kwoniella europaea PYCC6329]|uniref:Exonuclease V n=1 Tax=Kwoniella europaea PYCC6329 TaxID=1423913 RepID=A0AAX4KTA6_9TREE